MPAWRTSPGYSGCRWTSASAQSAPQPVVGAITAVGDGTITLDTGDEEVTLIVDDRSYLRLKDGSSASE